LNEVDADQQADGRRKKKVKLAQGYKTDEYLGLQECKHALEVSYAKNINKKGNL